MPIIILISYQHRKHNTAMAYIWLKVPIIINFWILCLLYVVNLLKSVDLIDQNILFGLDKISISILFLSFFVLVRELVFFEQLLSNDDESLFISESDSMDCVSNSSPLQTRDIRANEEQDQQPDFPLYDNIISKPVKYDQGNKEEAIMNAVYPVERARLSQNQKKNISMENELIEIIK